MKLAVLLAFIGAVAIGQPADAWWFKGSRTQEETDWKHKPPYGALPSYDRVDLARAIKELHGLNNRVRVVSARLSETRSRIRPGMTDYRELRYYLRDGGPANANAVVVEFTDTGDVSYHEIWDAVPGRGQTQIWKRFDPAATTLADDRGEWGRPTLNPTPVWGPFPELVGS